MELKGLNIGIGICGSFCTIGDVLEEMEHLKALGMNIIPIVSFNVMNTDTRFGRAEDILKRIKEITGNEIIKTIEGAEPIGPKKLLDALVLAPCTGNTMAKLNAGITDSPVLMAAKAHLRNNRPLIIAMATNDALGANLINIGGLINKKDIYFVPFGQDDYAKKPKSMIADFKAIDKAIELSLKGEQLQPIILR